MCDGIGPGWFGKGGKEEWHDGIISGIWRRLNELKIDLEPPSSARCVVPCSADSIFWWESRYSHRICNITAF